MRKVMFVLLLVLLSSFVFAVRPVDYVACYDFDSDFDDVTGNHNLSVRSGDPAIVSNNTKVGAGNLFLDQNDDLDASTLTTNLVKANFTVCYWQFSLDDNSNQVVWSFYSGSSGKGILPINDAANNRAMNLYNTASGVDRISINDGDGNIYGSWEFYCENYNGQGNQNGLTQWRNATNLTGIRTITGSFNGIDANTPPLIVGDRGDDATNYFGYIDTLVIFDRSLSQSEINDWYNSGAGASCELAPPPPVINESIESILSFSQAPGSITISTSTPVEIVSGSFDIVVNNTPSYTGIVLEVTPNNLNSEITCEYFINNISQVNTTRTMIANEVGMIYFTSPTEISIIGENNFSLECSKTSGVLASSIGVSGSDIAIHLLVDELGELINHKTEPINVNTSSVSLELLDTFFFNISNLTDGTGNILHSLVLDWDMNYNNIGATGDLETVFEINNEFNCSFYPRTVTSGTVGSVGGDCLVKNLSVNSTVTIKLYGGGTGNASFNGNLHLKDFFSHLDQLNNISLDGININSSSFVNVANFTIEIDADHSEASIFVKTGIPVFSNGADTEANAFINMTNGVVVFNASFQYARTTTSDIGVMVIQHTFPNISADTYNVNLFMSCDNSDCGIDGGNMIAYVTDTITPDFNQFAISAVDIFDNSSILSFNITSDIVNSSTSNGVLFVSTQLSFLNFSINSGEEGGYFSNVTLNHNTSNDLQVSLKQSVAFWDCVEKVSGVDLVCTSPLESDEFNYDVAGNPHSQSVNVTGYFEQLNVFNISALFNGTLISPMFSSNLSINVSSDFGVPFACSFNVSSFNHTFSEVVIGVPNSSIGLINGSYNVTADCIGFAEQTKNITINETAEFINFSLFTINSIFFRVFNITSLTLVTNNVDFNLKGDTLTVDDNTSTGLLFVGGLNDDTYRITVTNINFTPTVLFATVSNNSTQNIDVFLKSGIIKDFIVVDNLGVFQDDVVITFLQNINGTLITIGQTQTDFSGRSTIFLEETIEYTFFASKSGFTTFTGNVIPTESEYTIIIFRIEGGEFDSVFDDIKYATPFNYSANSSSAIANLVISSPSGSLQSFGLTSSYLGNNFSSQVSAFPDGAILDINITGLDPLVNDTVIVNYFFKAVGRDNISWSVAYSISSIVPANMSFGGGWFDDLTDLDRTNPIRGLVGFFVIVLLALIFGVAARDNTAAIFGGLLGLGLNWSFNLLPRPLLVVSMIACVILLMGDNSKGVFG